MALEKRALQVLVIGDDQRLCQELSSLIGKAGHRAACLHGKPPITAILQTSPDLIIIEASMPALSGLDILRRLQSHSQGRKIPIIVISEQTELQFELQDIFDFLPKPISHIRILENLDLLAAGDSATAACYPPLDGETLRLFQQYLVLHSGLNFDERNSKQLERGLLRRMRAVGVPSYLVYLEYLQRFHETRQEFKKLLSLLTVGETFFFRYQRQFEALTQDVLPELLKAPRKNRTLRLWSAGCSTGEEPYTLAITLLEHFPQLAEWNVQILATDINKRSLRKAREGIFSAYALRMTDAEIIRKYFTKVGDFYLLDTRPRQMVQFDYLNLQTGAFPEPANGTSEVDIIFCRNVMIYFGLDNTRKLVDRFAHCLRPGGYLFLGHAETLSHVSRRFQRINRAGAFYYRCQPEGEGTAALPTTDSGLPVKIKPLSIPTAAPLRGEINPPCTWSSALASAAPAMVPAVDDLLRQALSAFHCEDYRTTSRICDTILARDPYQVQALIVKGFILANQGCYDEALTLCVKVLGIDDLSAEAYFLRGLIFDMQDELASAMVEYRKTLLLDMGFIMGHYHLSKLHWRQGRERDAQRELTNTVRLLEKAKDDEPIPYSGGLSKGVFLELCREDSARLLGHK